MPESHGTPTCENSLSLGFSGDLLVTSRTGLNLPGAVMPDFPECLDSATFPAETHQPGPVGGSQVPALKMGGPEAISACRTLGSSEAQGWPCCCGDLA